MRSFILRSTSIVAFLFLMIVLLIHTNCGGTDGATVDTSIPSAADTSSYGLNYD